MTSLDKIDFKILKILQENGRITNIQLSNEIGLSPAPTLERVRKLEQSGFIKSYHAKVDEEMLGLNIMTYVQISINYSSADAIQEFSNKIQKMEEIVECHHIAGSSDYLIKIISKDMKSYEDFLVQKLTKMSEISALKSMMVLTTIKNSFSLPML